MSGVELREWWTGVVIETKREREGKIQGWWGGGFA